MIIRKGAARVIQADATHKLGAYESSRCSEAGGLTQFGAYVETLQPRSRSSERHWHEREDEFLYLVSGEAVVIEEDGAHVIGPGDSACWPAGAPNGHCVENRSNTPCTYVIVGTRLTHDVCHYPDTRRVLRTDADTWRLFAEDGTVLREGRVQND